MKVDPDTDQVEVDSPAALASFLAPIHRAMELQVLAAPVVHIWFFKAIKWLVALIVVLLPFAVAYRIGRHLYDRTQQE